MFPRFFLLILSLSCIVVNAKICRSLDIRSDISQFDKLKNCTKIVGFLKLVLLEEITKFPSFPDLREITEYVLVFRVPYLMDIGEILPNLTVIRGNVLLKGNSLIIHHNNQLKKIGLKNLRQIQRGNVQIGKSPNLCYVRTVNWTALGTSLARIAEITKCDKEECAPDCEGHCWSAGECQKHFDDNCHPECLGCSKPNSPKDCLVCKNLKDGDTCVSKCPPNKYISDEMFTCITEEECRQMDLPGERWIFENRCVTDCPEEYEIINKTTIECKPCIGRCTKECKGASIESKDDMEMFRGCTHIDGNIEIRHIDEYSVQSLAENLENIEEINGCLTVARSDGINSLQFLKNLKRIGGRDKQCKNYTVLIYENANLRKLIDVDKISTLGDVGISFHFNPELCISEIRKFASTLGVTKKEFDNILKEEKDISPYSNGEKASCTDIKLNVTFVEMNPNNVTLRWENYNDENVTVLGYTVFYILESELKSAENKKGESDISSNMCNDKGWMSRFVSKNEIQLKELQPYSKYVYWIKVFLMKTDTKAGTGGSTGQQTFTTVPDDPSKPERFIVKAVSPTSLMMTWEAPESPHGKLSYYHLLAFLEKDDPKFVSQRNYCVYPHVQSSSEEEIEPVDSSENITSFENGSCTCKTNVLAMDDTLCGVSNSQKRYSIDQCDKYNMYQVMEKKKMKKRYLPLNEHEIRSRVNESDIDIKLSSNETSYLLKNLKPFTVYIILFSACNEEFRGKPQCSVIIFSAKRTKANVTADRTLGVNFKVIDNQDVSVTWKDPNNPNGMIVAYNIEYKHTQNSKSAYVPDCITRTQHFRSKFVYRITDLDPGVYSLRIRPISLFGPGLYSKPLTFQIKSPLKIWVIYVFVCIVFVILVVIIALYLWYKMILRPDRIQLITSVNPDYENATVYIPDKWELDRNDVDYKDLIGQGSFGCVYNGYIKSKELPCAVKTINRNSTLSFKTEFLKEVSVMKNFSDTHHVVKLYGVVSIGDPPLVIMELMERGDLKEYLRKSRVSSQSISFSEMYLIAAQIADGMAYLASKKFVHRDLAARNCMVAADRTVKIGDFGMTKDIYETDYYKTGKHVMLPVRWMAPESLRDGVYSTESDVFGYGTVLWEMVTLAEQPYQGMTNEQVVSFVIARGRLNRPPECPDVLWEIMEACWKHRRDQRPLFIGIVEKLNPLIGASFALVSFYHSKQGRDYRLNYRADKQRETVTNIQTFPYETHHYDSEEVARLVPVEDELYPPTTRIVKRKSLGPDSSSLHSSYSISYTPP